MCVCVLLLLLLLLLLAAEYYLGKLIFMTWVETLSTRVLRNRLLLLLLLSNRLLYYG